MSPATSNVVPGLAVPMPTAVVDYSITAQSDGRSPRHALYLIEAKVGFSPYADGCRLAGTMELAGMDLSLNERRIAPLQRAASAYLREWRPRQATSWAGLRSVARVIGEVCAGR